MKRRIPVMAAAVIATALIAGSCFEPGSQPCIDGSVCPKNFKCTATGEACIPAESHCGDGIKDPDEACDDGNVKDGDGCSHDCKSDETCGNGIRDAVSGEACDDGNNISGDGCSADCQSKEGCGNNHPDPGEECDDGNDAGDDNCPTTCKIAFCGDGFVNDAGHREQCDDMGESVQCNGNCTWSSCGDQVLNRTAGEECDLGPVDTRTCTHLCKASFCGDLYINGDAGEICDDSTNGQTACPYGTPTCNACNATCNARVNLTGPFCGNHAVDPLPDGGAEACDDTTNGRTACPYGTPTCTGCSSCSAVLNLTGPSCGDLTIDLLPDGGTEFCDDLTRGVTSCAYGTPTCSVCNNGCSGLVTRTGPFCGDHTMDPLPDGGVEACDDTTNGRTVCPYGTPTCTGCSSCSAVLSLTGPFCGDLNIDPLPDGGTEFCDDLTRGVTSCGYGTPTCAVCNNTCTGLATRTGPFCGDHTVDPLPDGGAEVCDDVTNGRTACPYGTPTCTGCISCSTVQGLTGSFCGDDNVDPLPDGGVEQCDDSSRDAGACPYGTPTCQACGTNCRFRTLTGPFCGDHTRDALPDGGMETCDDSTTGMTSCSYGTPTCVACKADCSGTQSLTGSFCGDGARNAGNGEACDDGNTLACGTCSANCGQSQPGSAAIGSITAVGSSSLTDGDTFTLDDGVHTPEIFELDKDNAIVAGHVRVVVSGNAGTVADGIRTAVTNENTAGRLNIVPGGMGSTVSLTNTQGGTAGNRTITTNSALTVSGMSGGRAFDCPSGTGCVSNTDCAPGLTCQPVDGGTGDTCQ